MTHEELEAILQRWIISYPPVARTTIETAQKDIAKLFCHINELESVPLVQTIKEQEKQLGEALGNVVLWQETNRQSRAQANGYYSELVEVRKENERLQDIVSRFVTAFEVGDAGHLTLNGRSWSALNDAKQMLEGESHANL